MSDRTPDEDTGARRTASDLPVGGRRGPQGKAGRHTRWARAAGVVCVGHAVLLFGLAVFYGFELARGEGSSVTNVVLSLGLILVFAVLLLLLARMWWVGSTRAVVPTVVWNGLLIPVVVALYGADDRVLATGLSLLVAVALLTAVAGSLRSRPAA